MGFVDNIEQLFAGTLRNNLFMLTFSIWICSFCISVPWDQVSSIPYSGTVNPGMVL